MTTADTARAPAAPHRPAVGPLRRVLGRFHFSGVFWYRLHVLGVRILPRWAQHVFVAIFATGFFLALGRVRRAVASNLEAVLGPASWWTGCRRAYRTIFVFSHGLTDRYRRLLKPDDMKYQVEGESYWREATGGGRGAVVVTAHVGSWEMAAQIGTEDGLRTVHVVREEEIDPGAQAFLRSLMTRAEDHVVTHFAGDEMGLAIALAEALRKGELVALQADRPRAGGRVVMTQIFGRPMPLPVGPASLARSVDVPMIPVFAFREGDLAVRTVVRPPIVVARTADRHADVAAAMTQLAREIEWAIRERPHQWYCFRKLWD
jgi:phosphatidylinositol dimannoside acyltransferase